MKHHLLEKALLAWPKCFIKDFDLALLIPGTSDKRYSWLKRALKKKRLLRLKKGLYFLNTPLEKRAVDLFELAQLMYGPSYISLESALSWHEWIPEAVYTTTSVTIKRAATFSTPIGAFKYYHTPQQLFYLGVVRHSSKENSYLIATPWKALADCFYVYRKSWKTLEDVSLDLRIEKESFLSSDTNALQELASQYPSKRVRLFLTHILHEITHVT